jgi:orotate phosphoribosyltransferase
MKRELALGFRREYKPCIPDLPAAKGSMRCDGRKVERLVSTHPAQTGTVAESTLDAPARLAKLREKVRLLIWEEGYEKRQKPFQLSSGSLSYDYIDGKRALAKGSSLKIAAECILSLADSLGISFDAVGGLTMGADPLAHAVSIASGVSWFSVRKEPKAHGKQRLIEGSELGPGVRVVLVDDVITTGASIIKALDAIEALGGSVVLAVSLVDRGEAARVLLKERKVLYHPILTYDELNISPVGNG